MAILKLSKWGNSHGIRISKDVLESLNILESEMSVEAVKFDLSVEDNKLILTLKREKSPLEELFEGFNGNPADYKCEFDWGNPVGNEVW